MASARGAYTYAWPRPAVAVDAVVVAAGAPPTVLLIRRGGAPYRGHWACPGGFVDEQEPLDAAAARELLEETGVDAAAAGIELTQVGAFGDPGRDPRGWNVGVCYAAVVPAQLKAVGADDADEARYFPVADLPVLAFDHKLLLKRAFERLAERGAGGDAGLAAALAAAAGKLSPPWITPR